MIKYPDSLDLIFNKLYKNNIRAVIVGGYVRDSLLGINSKDIDIELYGVKSQDLLETILSEFGSVNSVGKSFGVIKLQYQNIELDFSLPREDNKTGSGHKGFLVTTHSELNYETAAKRRDFTLNAIGYDVIEKKLLDPFNGLKDLKDKTLNAINSDTFQEDPLRVLRGIGFSARFNFKMSQKLFLLCKNMIEKNMLDELSSERIYEELKKLLLKSKKPSIGFYLLEKLGGLKYFPELESLPEHDYKDLLLVLDNINKTKMSYMLAALCHKFSQVDIHNFINRLTTDKKILKDVITITQHQAKLKNIYKVLKDYEIYKLASYVNIEELLYLDDAIYLSKNKNSKNISGQKLKKRAKELGVLNTKAKEILQGRDIIKFGIKPSEIFSEILKKAYEAQIHSEFYTHKEALLWLKKNYKHLLL